MKKKFYVFLFFSVLIAFRLPAAHAMAMVSGVNQIAPLAIDSTGSCNALFSWATDTTDCYLIHFYDESSGSTAVISWYWSFGDPASGANNTSMAQNPVHVFTVAGTYSVLLHIYTADGCNSEIVTPVYVALPCNAEYNHYADSINPLRVHFWDDHMPSETVKHYYWSFGDGTTSDSPDPWHDYLTTGHYMVCLHITTPCDSTCYYCDSITVLGICNAAFESQADTADPLHIHFWDPNMDPGTVQSWYWDFGDGSPSGTTPDPWHEYASTGEYNVCLYISTIYGTTCNHCETIHAGYPCNAEFSHYADSLNPQHVHFYDANMPNGTVNAWYWSFGDSTTSTNADPWHVYAAAGQYTVCLYISTIYGTTCNHCETIQVGSAPCNAEFSYEPSGPGSRYIHFWDPNMPAGTVQTWYWSFGDGSISTNADPWHYYAEPGEYTACLHIATVYGTTCEHCESFYLSSTYDVDGHVYAGSNLADYAQVYLIRIDSLGGMTAIDSALVNDSSGMYHFGGVEPGNYFTKAYLLPASAYYGEFVPTYHEEALYWEQADTILPGVTSGPYNIHLLEMSHYTSGSGNIQGTISNGTKISEGGTPTAGVDVLILDPGANLLGYMITGSDGTFRFPEIALGTYTIYPELAGKQTVPATVTLDAEHLSSDIVFTIKNGKITLGLNDHPAGNLNAVSEVYPDPPVSSANLTLNLNQGSEVTVSIYSITGMTVETQNYSLKAGPVRISWDISPLKSGIYFAKVTAGSGTPVIRKFVISR